MQNQRWVVGVDCGEQRHRLVMLDGAGEIVESRWSDNELGELVLAFDELAAKAGGATLEVVTESLGSLGWAVQQAVDCLGHELFLVNAKALHSYRDVEGIKDKTDQMDAYLAARMRFQNSKGVRRPAPTSDDERWLGRLVRINHRLVGQETAASLRLRSRLLELCPEILGKAWEGPKVGSKGLLAILERYPAFGGLERARIGTIEGILRKATRHGDGCRAMARALKQLATTIADAGVRDEVIALELRLLVSDVQYIAAQLKVVLARCKALVDAHPKGPVLLEVPSIGYKVAAAIISEALPKTRILNEGKLATYSGLTPASRNSGKSKRSRLHRGVNRYLAKMMYMSAFNASTCSPIDHAYHQKKLEDYKGHPVAFTKATIALARQRHKLIYRLLTTDEHYDPHKLAASTIERSRRRKK